MDPPKRSKQLRGNQGREKTYQAAEATKLAHESPIWNALRKSGIITAAVPKAVAVKDMKVYVANHPEAQFPKWKSARRDVIIEQLLGHLVPASAPLGSSESQPSSRLAHMLSTAADVVARAEASDVGPPVVTGGASCAAQGSPVIATAAELAQQAAIAVTVAQAAAQDADPADAAEPDPVSGAGSTPSPVATSPVFPKPLSTPTSHHQSLSGDSDRCEASDGSDDQSYEASGGSGDDEVESTGTVRSRRQCRERLNEWSDDKHCQI